MSEIRQLQFHITKKKGLHEASVDGLLTYSVYKPSRTSVTWTAELQAEEVNREFFTVWFEHGFVSEQDAIDACQLHHVYRVQRCLKQ